MVSGADNAQDIEANLEWPDAIVAGPGMFENFWSEQIPVSYTHLTLTTILLV